MIRCIVALAFVVAVVITAEIGGHHRDNCQKFDKMVGNKTVMQIYTDCNITGVQSLKKNYQCAAAYYTKTDENGQVDFNATVEYILRIFTPKHYETAKEIFYRFPFDDDYFPNCIEELIKACPDDLIYGNDDSK